MTRAPDYVTSHPGGRDATAWGNALEKDRPGGALREGCIVRCQWPNCHESARSSIQTGLRGPYVSVCRVHAEAYRATSFFALTQMPWQPAQRQRAA